MILERRDVRERVRALAPFFVQGREILPVVADDSLYWALELYAASDDYPLATRFHVPGRAARTTSSTPRPRCVHAASGRVRLVLATGARADHARAGPRAFPSLFVRASALSPGARRPRCHPSWTRAQAQALAFADGGLPRRQPRGAALRRRSMRPTRRRRASRCAPSSRESVVAALWTLLDPQDRVRGMVAAVGGVTRETIWIPVARRRAALERRGRAPARRRHDGARARALVARPGARAPARGQAALPPGRLSLARRRDAVARARRDGRWATRARRAHARDRAGPRRRVAAGTTPRRRPICARAPIGAVRARCATRCGAAIGVRSDGVRRARRCPARAGAVSLLRHRARSSLPRLPR